ncbi:hypothetical protein PAECIP111892_03613 [Paenibacillus auburnensis]|uniref:Replication protein n=1 Tax=Paenibacillus auburnensis TaxID=2905649 RepID=A0ABM9CGI7_9BACL|nr:hypothetical protein [Paenibacillus auburnensis]CAH1211639.1 hypothetical protein PAECIP111892_03613 [Paenibacillus auburnensis]
MNNRKDFLRWESTTMDTVDFKRIYVDMANGDLLAGLFLSQIVFWYLPDQFGKSKLRVSKKGHYWIAKSTEDWKKELRFSRSNLDTVLRKLTDLSIIEEKIFKFNGAPTKHIRLIEGNFLKSWEIALSNSEYKDESITPMLNLPEVEKSNRSNKENGFVQKAQNYNIKNFKDYKTENQKKKEEEEEGYGNVQYPQFLNILGLFKQHNLGFQHLTDIQILYLEKMCEYNFDSTVANDILQEIGDLNQYHPKALEEALLKMINRIRTGNITDNPIAWLKKVLKNKNLLYTQKHSNDDPFSKDYTHFGK